MQQIIQHIVRHYDNRYHPDRFEYLNDSGGFSGADVFQLHSPAGQFCLRGWPVSDLPAKRIRGLHRLLAVVAAQGVSQVAVPIKSLDDTTLVKIGDRYWQLEPWMPGQADFRQHPSDLRIRAAVHCLADWHRAVLTFVPRPAERVWFYCLSDVQSPAIIERLDHIQRYRHGRIERIRRLLMSENWLEFRETGEQILELFQKVSPRVTGELETACSLHFRLQPCLRDIWHDHVLFTDDAVTGLIDASACRSENVATDLARMIGSFVGDDRKAWDVALAAYQQQRPLTLDELGLVEILDRSGVVLSGIVWLDRWYLQGRRPTQQDRVHEILNRILERLERVQ